ncbi:MAG: hypothetical protein QGG54_15550, partial [Gammaproteobacteria bacterium]|nr:hypothetical protein [Gammaproteobacteria bacterium]
SKLSSMICSHLCSVISNARLSLHKGGHCSEHLAGGDIGHVLTTEDGIVAALATAEGCSNGIAKLSARTAIPVAIFNGLNFVMGEA